MRETTRRDLLRGMGGVALGIAATSSAAGLIGCAPAKAASIEVPWPYKNLDPAAVAERAYAAYYEGGCMYGAFEGIVGELRDRVGGPFKTFPAGMMKYGAAGVNGWGTLCGALNGIAAAAFLLAEDKNAKLIVNEVYGWYGAEALPNYKPQKPKFEQIATSIANSQLCHVSVTTWSKASGFKTGSPERAERCAWLTASVAKYTVELLNQLGGAVTASHKVPAEVSTCLSCHGKGGTVENVHISDQTTCKTCHSTLPENHPQQ